MANNTQTPKPAWASTGNLLIAIIVILVLLIVFLGGVATGHFATNSDTRRTPVRTGPRLEGGPTHADLRGMLGNKQSAVAGAVTNISGDSFTVAGNGTTIQVITSNSTQYKGANAVKVNDTVVAIGTKSGDKFQAERVVVNPLQGL